MFEHLNVVAASVFIFFFALVTVLGFVAARWKAADLDHILEWGLGGRRFGPWITWFLLGGDLYTAYTVIAVPAVIYAIGAFGFFAVPYTIIIYPFLYLTLPRLWAVSHKRGYMTAGDFVLGRYGDRWLELAVALTGILATMPYIALQLVGLEKVIGALGFSGEGLMQHAPITIAFVILALYTYKSGLRAPAMIAFVKDAMIYVFIVAAVVIVPYELGGFGKIFEAARVAYAAKVAAKAVPAAGLTLAPGQIGPYITLAIGSAMALFMYPHALTGALAASSGRAIRQNTMMLPAYSFVLGLIALLGVMALAAGISVKNPQDAVPQLVLWAFPDWFAGFCFAAIALGALVPAAIMSIGAANTFTRNVWKPFVHPQMTTREELFLAKLVSLIVKLGALMVICLHADPVRARSAAPGRGMDGPDLSSGDLRALRAMVQRPGAAGRLGGRHDHRNVARLGRESLDSGARPEMGRPLRRACRHGPRLRRLQRPDRGGGEPRRGGASLVRSPVESARRNLAGGLRRPRLRRSGGGSGWRFFRILSAFARARMSAQAWRFCAGCRKR